MQAAERLHEALANLAFASPRRKERKGLTRLLEQLGQVVVLAVRDVAFTEHTRQTLSTRVLARSNASPGFSATACSMLSPVARHGVSPPAIASRRRA